jgi:pyruvate/2-oxoglutarate/acetoin dehydrogenase E1 component
MKVTYAEALRIAMEEIMAEQPEAVVLGQDVRTWGGASEIFLGLYEKYPERVFDTPITELGTTGIAVGLAMQGMRPIVENTFIDFVLHAIDPIINQAAKVEYMSAGQVSAPIIVRGVISSQRGYGPTHSQSLENLFFDVPGLQVVYPSNPSDAYGLLKASFKSNKPVIFVEHKLLHKMEGELVKTPVEIGKAKVVTEGDKLTVVSWGRMITHLMDISYTPGGIEVIDLRSLSPIDYETVLKSVKKTGKLLLVEEGYGTISAEITATIAEKAFSSLKAPITRIHAEREVIPFREEEENRVFPNKEKIQEAIQQIIS